MQLLRDSDASSMAHSLELRVPFVDLELVRFARSCRDEYKLHADGGDDGRYDRSGAKRVLIHALRDLLPPRIADRPKRGFALPYEQWMKRDLAPLVDDACSDASVKRRGLLDPDMVSGTRDRAARGVTRAVYPQLWALMVLEFWCRAVLDADRNTPIKSHVARTS
jgi:asparagine synthase (glutamine-hydrolysing)